MAKALKFGGTSMANADSIRKVRDIVMADPEAKYVVVSAPGKREPSDTKVTDMLIALCGERTEEGRRAALEKIKARFDGIIEGLGIDLDLTADFEDIMSGEESGSYDYVVSRGEYLSAKVLAKLIGYDFVDAADIVRFGADGKLDDDLTQRLASERLRVAMRAVVPGFYGTGADGRIKTFSRGGSDVSGAIVAKAVNASVYENWTDVDGFMVCDPRKVKNPRIIEMLTYRELRELAYMGASVLHPEAVFPVNKSGIPINIRNTFNPSAKGTMIVCYEDLESGRYKRSGNVITGIAGKKDFVGIFIQKEMMNSEIGFCRTLLDVLVEHNIRLEHMPTGIDTVTLILDPAGLTDEVLEETIMEIRDRCHLNTIEVHKGLSLIAVVGHGMMSTKGTASRVCGSLYNADVNIRMIDQGSSEMNIIIAVENEDYDRSIAALYHEFVG
ncbi:MAG TPA: aspartate kinase [Candidatus Protoclostridium stercorigallinarum]|uniref:Aspartokinase n=1 Tax=Candidatus Protoclostridium stercorigallinarum TaxID=2838741 RepID=A0A9D1PZX8_9FIRM|nr:aspartate kinase [Candidatus Protoclostridium stercorigallinarum]